MSKKDVSQFAERLGLGQGVALRRAREERRMTQAELAELVGTTQQTVDRIEKGQIKQSKLYPALAEAVGLPNEGFNPDGIEEALKGLEAEAAVAAKQALKRTRALPSADLDDGSGMVIYSRDQSFTLQPADQIERGYPVTNVPDAYAVYVQDSRLAPSLSPGDMAVLNPHIPVFENCDAFLTSDTGPTRKGMFRRIVGIFDGYWQVAEAEGLGTEKVSREEWPHAHLVVAKFYRVR